jgi:hypothetical protein
MTAPIYHMTLTPPALGLYREDAPMIKMSTSSLIALLAIACSSEPTEPRAYAVAPPQGTLDVEVKVSGDPSTGPSTYGVVLNTNLWADLPPDKVLRASLPTGRYQLSLAGLTAPLNPLAQLAGVVPAWCVSVGANPQSVEVVEGVVQAVKFTVNCPPLVGAGSLTVTIAASGVDKPREVPVTITRLTNGPKHSQTITVMTNDSLATPWPVGVHQVAVGAGSSCKGVYPTPIPILAPQGHPPSVVLRDKAVARVKLTVACS